MGRVESALAALRIEVAENKRGRLWARCPYHSPDNHPSWCVRTTKERYGQHFCFSCKNGGPLHELVQHLRKVDEREAREWLRQLGGEDEEKEAEPLPQLVRLEFAPLHHRAFKLPGEFIHEPLADWVTPARRYVEARAITAEQVERWGLGYAVDGRLAGRVIIPTFAWGTGVPTSYMARSFTRSPKRYMYPDAGALPDLDTMFGEVFWPPSNMRKAERVVVVEGAFNALAVERAVPFSLDLPYLAALGGSFVRPMHVGKLASFGEVVIFTDTDRAGDVAAAEITAALVRHVPRIRRVALPAGAGDANDATVEQLRCLLR